LKEWADFAKTKPNTHEVKYTMIATRVAEDVATAWHVILGQVEKK